jgi:hypothetical protein
MRFWHISITAWGVARVFFAKTSRITTALPSIRYIRRQFALASVTLNSWQRAPIEGMGLDAGIPNDSPLWRRRNKYPISTRAGGENGGVFIAPPSHTMGLSLGLTAVMLCQNRHGRKESPNKSLLRAGTHKVLARGRASSSIQGARPRAPTGRRAAAELSRWAA